MSNREPYSKAIAKVIAFDISDPIFTKSKGDTCYGNEAYKHSQYCREIASSDCGKWWCDYEEYSI